MSCCNKGWVAISGAGPSGPEPALPGPGNSEMQDKIPHIIKSLWPESLEEHLPINIAGVLRLRAVSPVLSDRSARRFAQDDDSVVGIKNIGSSAKNTKRSKKSQALGMTKGGVVHPWGIG